LQTPDAELVAHTERLLPHIAGGKELAARLTPDRRPDPGTPWTVRVERASSIAGRTVDRYSLGTRLSGDNVRWIVENAIWNRSLPNDPWGIYVVLPTPDVDQDGFCVQHCGWHTYTQWGNERVLYSFIGNSERCPNVCGVRSPSANDNPVGDAMVSVLGHELSETVSDPYLDGWFDANGEENADKCAWNFGSTFGMSNGSVANIAIGDRYYLVQQNWAPANPGYCTQGAF